MFETHACALLRASPGQLAITACAIMTWQHKRLYRQRLPQPGRQLRQGHEIHGNNATPLLACNCKVTPAFKAQICAKHAQKQRHLVRSPADHCNPCATQQTAAWRFQHAAILISRKSAAISCAQVTPAAPNLLHSTR